MLTLREHRWKIAIAAVVVVLVALIGLFIRDYNSGSDSSAPKVGPSSGGFTPTVDTRTATASSTSASASPGASGSGVPKGGVKGFTFPNGLSYTGGDPNFFRFQKQHIVLLRVFSAGNAQLIRVGWLAPESYDAPYGDTKGLASPWSLTLHSSGEKYHAALFIGTDSSGNPVTCEIYVDGVLKDRLRAEHPFARQTCVG